MFRGTRTPASPQKKSPGFTPTLTSALEGGAWSTPLPSCFTPGKDPVRAVQEAAWAPRPVWTGAESLTPPLVFDPRTVQPVASRYTDWAIPDHVLSDQGTKITGT